MINKLSISPRKAMRMFKQYAMYSAVMTIIGIVSILQATVIAELAREGIPVVLMT